MSGNPVTSLTCVIIDDEQPAHNVLQFHIQQISWLSYLKGIYNAVDALTLVPALRPDIIFLDVNMPNLNGLKMLDLLPLSHQSNIILCSAYPEYALEGYDYEVSSFLLKPVMFDKFLKAVNRVRLRASPKRLQSISHSAIEAEKNITIAGISKAPDSGPVDQEQLSSAFFNQEAIWVRSDKKQLKIYFDEIKFIEAQKNYVKIYYSNKQEVLTRSSLHDMEINLPSQKFVRTHKSYIVNRRAVTEINGNTITLDNDYRVSISQKERNEVCRRLTQ